LRANFGTMTKALHAGQAAEGGVRAALLSSRGFTANGAIFDAPGGFFSTYGAGAVARDAPAALEIDASGIGIKPYACCGAGVSLVDAALDLRAAHAPGVADIGAVEAVVSEMAASIMPFRTVADGLQAKYCLAYCASVALIDGYAGLAQFEDERALRPDVQELLARVSVRADKRMAQGAGRFGVELRVRLRDGKVLEAALELPRGHPQRPIAREALVAKFLECAGPVLGEARARAAAGRLESLEKIADIRKFTDLLRP
jgi:2-methylcitrate dehydratase PrpD